MKTTTKDHLRNALGRVAETIRQFAQAADTDIERVETALSDHTGNKNNPHGVTAALVGALSTRGGTVTGKTTFSGGLAVTDADSNNSMQFFLGIKAFAEGGDVQWIDRTRMCACIGAAAAGHTHKLSGSVTIPKTGWGSDSTATYPKYYDIAVTGVTASDRANVDIATASMSAAMACGLCPVTETLAGKIRIRAASVPGAAMTANYWIEKGA